MTARSPAASSSAKPKPASLRNVGDPVALAIRYNEQGADEMVFFDITASAHGRATMVDVIERAANQCFMPLTVGGGIKSVDDMFTMLRGGRGQNQHQFQRSGRSKADPRGSREIRQPVHRRFD